MTNRQKGILFRLLSSLFFCIMGIFIKYSGDLPIVEKAFFRNLFAVIVTFVVLLKHKKRADPLLIHSAIPLQLLRSLTGTLAMLCNFYAIEHLLFSDATTINKVAPFCLILFSFLLLKERPALSQILFMILGFLGVAVVFRPGFTGGNLTDYFIALLGGVGGGFATACVRKLNLNGVPQSQTVFAFSFVSTFVCLILNINHFIVPNPFQMGMLLMIGIMGTLGQFTMTAAFSYAPASQISIYDYAAIIFASIFSIFIFHEIPDFISVIGYFIVIGAGFGMYINDGKKEAKQVLSDNKISVKTH